MRRASSVALACLLVAGSLALLVPVPPAAGAGQVSVYMPGLNFPIALAFSPDGRIFFAERFSGNIRIIRGGVLLATPFYTLPNTTTAGERGLLGLALDPGFPAIPWVYAYQTYNDATNGTFFNRVVRIQASGDVGVAVQVVLAMPPLSVATNHNGGVIAFGPDGKLYVVVGENANQALSQNPMSLLGKVLRLNPDGSAPTDNPFYGSLTWDNRIFTYGHRNMFGLDFHPLTGRVFVTENGPNCNDEINLLAAGANYGWGTTATCATPPPAPQNTNRDGPNPILPIWWWTMPTGMPTICPTNAAIYAGPYFPAWQGDLFMGDCNTGRLHRLDLSPPNYDAVASDNILWTAPTSIIEVEQGPDGAIWFTTPSTIYRYWDSGRPPVAAFTASPSPTTAGVPVTFDASTSTDPDGTIVSYAWDFGDTTTGTGVTTSHAYAASGTYTVRLTVVDNETYSANTTRDVVVEPGPPVASFTATPNPAPAGTPIAFDASGSSDPDGTIVSYAWDFGDTATGTGVTTSHAYAASGTYTVRLTVVDNEMYSSNTTRDVVIQPAPPVASFTAAPNPVAVGVPVSFDASTSSDPDGTIVSYAWDFGDTATGTGVTTSHAYAAAGTYTVTLTVVDDQSLFGNASAGVVAFVGPSPPVASFTVTPFPVNPGMPVTFDASASYDPDGTIVSYAWDFGDTSTGSGRVATHPYAIPGVYTATLTVTDNASLSSNASRPVLVNRPPRASIAYSPYAVYVTTSVAFDGTGSTDPDGTIASYAWDFGDGASDTGPTPAHTFSRKGPYTVALTVTDALGLSNTSTAGLVVRNRPPRITSSTPGAGAVTVATGSLRVITVVATDPDGDPLAYAWTVDGAPASETGTSLNFSRAAPGTYIVNVTVSDGDGGADWREWTVVVSTGGGAEPVLPVWLAGFLLVVAVAAVLVVVFYMWWARRRREKGEPIPPPPPV